MVTAKPAPSNSGPRLRIAQYSRKLDIPRRGWRTRQMALKVFSMVTSMKKAVTASSATPAQVRCRAWVVKSRRYCCTVSPEDGTKLRKMKFWICSPVSWKAGTAESMAKVTVITGTTANSVV